MQRSPAAFLQPLNLALTFFGPGLLYNWTDNPDCSETLGFFANQGACVIFNDLSLVINTHKLLMRRMHSWS